MKPTKIYTGRSTIRMYLGDCMDLMKAGTWDLAIVDPPYGIDWMNQIQNPNTNKNWKKYESKSWDKNLPDEYYFKALFDSSENQIVWGGNYMIENLYSSPCWLIWDKMQEFTGAVFEMAWTSFESPAKAFRMSRVQSYTNGKIHPTQKPVQLYKWLLTNYANEGDTILDTHGGSMSIAIACWDLGFDLDIIELDEDYFNDAVKRFEQHISQTQLF